MDCQWGDFCPGWCAFFVCPQAITSNLKPPRCLSARVELDKGALHWQGPLAGKLWTKWILPGHLHGLHFPEVDHQMEWPKSWVCFPSIRFYFFKNGTVKNGILSVQVLGSKSLDLAPKFEGPWLHDCHGGTCPLWVKEIVPRSKRRKAWQNQEQMMNFLKYAQYMHILRKCILIIFFLIIRSLIMYFICVL